MVQAAYNQGAATVVGFRNNVAAGEYYVEKVIDMMRLHPNMSIGDAMNNVDATYTAAERSDPKNPSNPNNRVTIGLTSMTINMN